MRDRVWIIFNRQKVDRVTLSDKFTLHRGEKVVTVDIEVPDSVFEPPPKLEAKLVVAEQSAKDAPAIVLDPDCTPVVGKGDFNQQHLNRMAAQLMERAINSTDPAMKEMALNALAICKDAGVEVRIEVPEASNE